MESISIKKISHRAQRYNTVGDYFMKGKVLHFKVSDMGNPDFEMACLLHELVERHLCQKAGVTDKEIDAWDLKCKDNEPGLNRKAPYHKQHMVADAIERLFIQLCGADWREYEKRVDKLSDLYEKGEK